MARHRVSIAVAVALMALVAAAILAPSPGLGQTGEAAIDTVTVTAAGKVEGRPDLASVSFGIRQKDATASGTMDALSARQTAVIDALRATGLSQEQITTGNISLDEACHYDRSLRRTVCEGFVARTSVRAETTDFDAVGGIIDAGVDAGATSVNDVSFERTEDNEAIKEALDEAMGLAIAKAEVLATSSGRTLGRAMIIEEGGAQRPVFSTSDALGAPAARGSAAGFVINPPDQITKVRIVVTFALN